MQTSSKMTGSRICRIDHKSLAEYLSREYRGLKSKLDEREHSTEAMNEKITKRSLESKTIGNDNSRKTTIFCMLYELDMEMCCSHVMHYFSSNHQTSYLVVLPVRTALSKRTPYNGKQDIFSLSCMHILVKLKAIKFIFYNCTK